MNDRLEDLLRDPRAHGDAPDAAEVRAWSNRALERWRGERAAAAERARRWTWRDVATGLGLASAAAALAPVAGDLLGRAWTALTVFRVRVPELQLSGGGWLEAFARTPPLLLAGGAVLVFLCVPQLRSAIGRLLDA